MSKLKRETLIEMFDPAYESVEDRDLVDVIRYLDGNEVLVQKKYKSLKNVQAHELKLLFDVLHAKVSIYGKTVNAKHYVTGLRKVEARGSSFESVGGEIVMHWAGFDLQDWQKLLPLNENAFFCHATFLLQLLKRVIEALLALYEMNFIHCDIKADNLCIALDINSLQKTATHLHGTIDPSRLKIIDLGLCFRRGSKDLHSFPNLKDLGLNRTDGRCQALVDAYAALAQGNSEPLSRLDWRLDCYDMGRVFKALVERAENFEWNLHGPTSHRFCLRKLVHTMSEPGDNLDFASDNEEKGTSPPIPSYLDWLKEIDETFEETPPRQKEWIFSVPKELASETDLVPERENQSLIPGNSDQGIQKRGIAVKWLIACMLILACCFLGGFYSLNTGDGPFAEMLTTFLLGKRAEDVNKANTQKKAAEDAARKAEEKRQAEETILRGVTKQKQNETTALQETIKQRESAETSLQEATEKRKIEEALLASFVERRKAEEEALQKAVDQGKVTEETLRQAVVKTKTEEAAYILAVEKRKVEEKTLQELVQKKQKEEETLRVTIQQREKEEEALKNAITQRKAAGDAAPKSDTQATAAVASSKTPLLLKSTHTNSIGMEFVLIPAGDFMMGSDKTKDKEAYDDETPQHKVTISQPYYLGKYEVTQAQWKKIMGNNPSHFKGDNLPVDSVSWNDAREFIKKLNQKEGHNRYRLPTEAEWEYAARAGSTTAYSFGCDEKQLGKYAWFDGGWGTGSTHPVGQKLPNPWGLYDMHGNVWEWVEDVYGKDYYKKSLSTDPKGPDSGEYRVLRGGSWYDVASICRSAYRYDGEPDFRCEIDGFRLALSPE